MRRTLIVWLVEVHREYHLRQETLHLTVNILDRYCSIKTCNREHYQLLGMTCLWLAAKYEGMLLLKLSRKPWKSPKCKEFKIHVL